MKIIYSVIIFVIFLSMAGCQSVTRNGQEGGSTTIPESQTPTTSQDIILTSPQPGSKISSPLSLTGQARGNWYFEGSFPILLTDDSGTIIAEGYTTAQGEWMTEDFVPFTAELEFIKPSTGGRGNLILHKANPSDLPENDDSIEIIVSFE